MNSMRENSGTSRRRWTGVLVVLGLLGVLVNAPVSAQVGGANMGGVVTDGSGGVLPGVTITITNTATGRAQTLVTSDEGRYRAVALQPGPYEVAAELQGFGTVRRDVVLPVGADATVDITLGVATLAETVTVVGETPLVEVAKSQPSSVITSRQLESLPVLNRHFLVLAQLLPGAAPWRAGTFAVTKFGAVADPRTAYSTVIDGADIDDPIYGHPSINLSQDVVSEFKVYRNQFDAQYGSAMAAVVTVVTKSGTNRMSGSGFYFGRDRKLNATNAFARSKPPFQQSRIGGSFGGPIVRNRTHFFTGYERLMVDSAVVTGLPATNPFATLENGIYPNKTRNQNLDARVDHRFNDAHSMFVRYAFDDQLTDGGDRPVRVVGGLGLGPNTSVNFSRAHSVVTEENWILSSTKVNTLRVHYKENHIRMEPHSFDIGVIRPSFTWGQNVFHPQHFPERRISLFETLFITAGRHDMKIGGDFTYGSYGVDGHFNEHGTFSFNTDAPFDPNNPATWPFQFVQRTPGFRSFKENQIAGYVQDSWGIHPRVRLNLGLRYDLNTDPRDNAFYVGVLNNPKFAGLDRFISKDRGNDYDNIQPRVGVAWDIRGNGTLVGRAGWGLYVTRDKPWIQIAAKDTVIGDSVLIQDPQRLRFFPAINAVLGGQTLAQAASVGGARSVKVVGDDFEPPQQANTTIGVGWELTSSTSLDVDYVHGHGTKQLGSTDRNLPPSGAISASNPRPVPAFSRIHVIENYGESWYDALELQIRQRVRGGNSLQASYTLSRALLDGATAESGIRGTQRTPQEKGYNLTDTRHNLSVSASQSLPWGFQVSAIARVISGNPLTVSAGVDLDGDGDTTGDRPRGLPPRVGRGDVDEELRVINEYRGSLGLAPFTRDRVTLKPFRSIDVRATKVVSLTGARRLEMFLEAFNLTNFVNKTGGNGNIRVAAFFLPTGALDARQVQWGVRLAF